MVTAFGVHENEKKFRRKKIVKVYTKIRVCKTVKPLKSQESVATVSSHRHHRTLQASVKFHNFFHDTTRLKIISILFFMFRACINEYIINIALSREAPPRERCIKL